MTIAVIIVVIAVIIKVGTIVCDSNSSITKSYFFRSSNGNSSKPNIILLIYDIRLFSVYNAASQLDVRRLTPGFTVMKFIAISKWFIPPHDMP